MDHQIGGTEGDVIERLSLKLLNEVYAETYSIMDKYKAALVKGIHVGSLVLHFHHKTRAKLLFNFANFPICFFFKVLVEEGELYLDDIELLLDLYPPGMTAEQVNSEEDPSRLVRPKKNFEENVVLEEQETIQLA